MRDTAVVTAAFRPFFQETVSQESSSGDSLLLRAASGEFCFCQP